MGCNGDDYKGSVGFSVGFVWGEPLLACLKCEPFALGIAFDLILLNRPYLKIFCLGVGEVKLAHATAETLRNFR